jgi:hypothetical protein
MMQYNNNNYNDAIYAYSIVVDSLNLWFQAKIICSASIKKYTREEEEEGDLMDFPAVARSSNLR